MSRINMTKAACIGLSALLAVGMFSGTASARWGDNDNGNRGNHGNHYGHQDRDWNNNGYYYRAPPVIYTTPYRYGYYPPPVVYGPEVSLPGLSIQLR